MPDPTRTRPHGPATTAAWTAALAAAATVAVVAVPFLAFAYRAPALRAVLETANAIVALVVAFLVYGRFRHNRRLQDLLMVLALCTVAVANLVLTAVPSALALARGEEFSRWEALAIRLIGTVVLASAALVPPRVRAERRTVALSVTGVAALVVAVTATGLLLGEALPPMVDPTVPLDDATTPRLVAHPLVAVVHGVGAALYAVAAFAYTRQSARTGDQLLRWVGAGCVVAAAARVHYLLFPSLYSEFVHTGDVLRLGFYLLLLVGAAAEIRSYWELRMQAAVLEDRRRMARDLHDGLTQELAYIAAQSQRIRAHPGDTRTADLIGAAASRASDEARRAIAALTRPAGEPFAQALQRLADELTHRHDVKIVTAVDAGVVIDGNQEETLLRIVAEAVRNAVRHGRAKRIEVRLDGQPSRLAVVDDGSGFAPDTRPEGGFGLTSMRERASAVGAALEVTSVPGEGTKVEVTWP